MDFFRIQPIKQFKHIFVFHVDNSVRMKTALKLVWFPVYFSPNYKSIQIPMEQTLFEEGENL